MDRLTDLEYSWTMFEDWQYFGKCWKIIKRKTTSFSWQAIVWQNQNNSHLMGHVSDQQPLDGTCFRSKVKSPIKEYGISGQLPAEVKATCKRRYQRYQGWDLIFWNIMKIMVIRKIVTLYFFTMKILFGRLFVKRETKRRPFWPKVSWRPIWEHCLCKKSFTFLSGWW